MNNYIRKFLQSGGIYPNWITNDNDKRIYNNFYLHPNDYSLVHLSSSAGFTNNLYTMNAEDLKSLLRLINSPEYKTHKSNANPGNLLNSVNLTISKLLGDSEGLQLAMLLIKKYENRLNLTLPPAKRPGEDIVPLSLYGYHYNTKTGKYFLPDGTIKTKDLLSYGEQYALDNKLPFIPGYLNDKPLTNVYPEFYILLGGKGLLNGAFNATKPLIKSAWNGIKTYGPKALEFLWRPFSSIATANGATGTFATTVAPLLDLGLVQAPIMTESAHDLYTKSKTGVVYPKDATAWDKVKTIVKHYGEGILDALAFTEPASKLISKAPKIIRTINNGANTIIKNGTDFLKWAKNSIMRLHTPVVEFNSFLPSNASKIKYTFDPTIHLAPDLDLFKRPGESALPYSEDYEQLVKNIIERSKDPEAIKASEVARLKYIAEQSGNEALINGFKDEASRDATIESLSTTTNDEFAAYLTDLYNTYVIPKVEDIRGIKYSDVEKQSIILSAIIQHLNAIGDLNIGGPSFLPFTDITIDLVPINYFNASNLRTNGALHFPAPPEDGIGIAKYYTKFGAKLSSTPNKQKVVYNLTVTHEAGHFLENFILNLATYSKDPNAPKTQAEYLNKSLEEAGVTFDEIFKSEAEMKKAIESHIRKKVFIKSNTDIKKYEKYNIYDQVKPELVQGTMQTIQNYLLNKSDCLTEVIERLGQIKDAAKVAPGENLTENHLRALFEVYPSTYTDNNITELSFTIKDLKKFLQWANTPMIKKLLGAYAVGVTAKGINDANQEEISQSEIPTNKFGGRLNYLKLF